MIDRWRGEADDQDGSGSGGFSELGLAWSPLAARQPAPGPDPVATFSILGVDPATGEVGGAVQSRVFSVGNGVLWAEAGVGAAATQAIVDVSYGPKAIALLRAGLAPAAIIDAIWASDRDPATRALDQAGPAVRGDRRRRQHRRVHRAEGDRVGRAPGGEVLHRAGQHPGRRSGRRRAWSRRSRARRGTCRSG